MTDQSLRACRILVVEDEYLLADELATELTNAGAQVLGPAPTIEVAQEVLAAGSAPDGAILDVNLSGAPVYPLADMLIGRGVPLVFTTGYDPDIIPQRFADVPKCSKPINVARIAAALGLAIHS